MKSFVLASLAFVLCSSSTAAEKITAAISLRHMTPSGMMWSLGLFSLTELGSGGKQVWSREKQSPPPAASQPGVVAPTVDASKSVTDPVLPGVDLVAACDRDGVMIAYGTQEGIERLKSKITELDVPRRQIQVKAEFVSVRTEDVKASGLEAFLQGTSDEQAGDIRESLRKLNAEVVSSPILSVLAGHPGTIEVNSSKGTTSLGVLPTVNADATITLALMVSRTESNPEKKQTLFTQRRVSAGETILLGGFVYRDGEIDKELAVFLTPSYID